MVESLQDLKQSLKSSLNPSNIPSEPALSLLDNYSELVAFDRKLESYTLAKCAYERNMETCILEYLYFNNRARSLLQDVKQCRQENRELDTCLQGLDKRVQELKGQVQGMIEISKKEFSEQK